MTNRQHTLVFVHGWSVTNTSTYGGLPARLRAEAAARGMSLDVAHLFLGRYISFNDDVTIADVSRAFESAVQEHLADAVLNGQRFACVTHSTGGPLIRDWWSRYYGHGRCPMSHLIMLAPANFGSALAQLGKGRLGRIKAWADGIEPGAGILDWLELGSRDGLALNEGWISASDQQVSARTVLPFVLTGQSIDRAIYDHLNSYTGEPGSDGVVRVAAANLNCRQVVLEQSPAKAADAPLPLEITAVNNAPQTAFGLIPRAAHSGRNMGIMRSVSSRAKDGRGTDVVDAILECLAVDGKREYRRLCDRFRQRNQQTQLDECVETVRRPIAGTSHYLNDRYSMLVFRLRDDRGAAVDQFDLLLTAGPNSDPNVLPRGFFGDRQRNSRQRNVLTYYLNYDLMRGSDARKVDNETVRDATTGIDSLGISLRPRPSSGFAHYLPAQLPASADAFDALLAPNQTTLVDIILRRVVRGNTFGLDTYTGGSTRRSFKRIKPGGLL